jgi:hypothetical protein
VPILELQVPSLRRSKKTKRRDTPRT